VLTHHAADREAQRMQANREELVERIGRALPVDGLDQPLPGLYLYRSSVPLEPIHGVTEPSVCVIAQGSKEIMLGDSRYQYDPLHYLLCTIELPSVRRVLDASRERPYLSLRLELPPTVVGSVMVDSGHSSSFGSADTRAVAVSPVDASLLDA